LLSGRPLFKIEPDSYAWVGTRQIWGVGTVNLATGKIHIDGYMQ
jgi:hypothetical protein